MVGLLPKKVPTITLRLKRRVDDDEAALDRGLPLRNWTREPFRPYGLRVGVIRNSSLDEAYGLGAACSSGWRQLFLKMARRDVVAGFVMG